MSAADPQDPFVPSDDPSREPVAPDADPRTALPHYPRLTDDPAADPAAQETFAPPGYPAPAYYARQPYDPEAKSRIAAGLLGIFLGGIGVHRFYLGYTGIGLLQIAVTVLTAGVGAIWGLIEGIMILARAQAFAADAEGRPLRDEAVSG